MTDEPVVAPAADEPRGIGTILTEEDFNRITAALDFVMGFPYPNDLPRSVKDAMHREKNAHHQLAQRLRREWRDAHGEYE